MASTSPLLWRHLRIYTIYGANTDIGKTIFATALCNAASKYAGQTAYLKPVSTGPETDSDSLCKHINKYASSTMTETLFQYDIPCSPHKAARASGNIPTDASLRAAISQHASNCAKHGSGWLFVETAGGVHSPGPSGTPQSDLYAPLRSPIVLVGDAKLGGISQTIAAFESLKLRGLDVHAVVMFKDDVYENYSYLRDHFEEHGGIPVATLSMPPERHENHAVDHKAMLDYYREVRESGSMTGVLQMLHQSHADRIKRLDSMSSIASQKIWYPFTQQKLLTPDRISTIDSAYGDDFQVLKQIPEVAQDGVAEAENAQPLLEPAFDGSASWWTQGLGHGNPRLALAAAYAAGRYGHVMFAEAIHEPALALAETLLRGMKNPRLTRVFFSDNGSTGCEVAVKMALRASRKRYGWTANDRIEILGLKGSYHGDTIGTMDCSEPSIFNEKVEWYQGKGFWFDFPSVWLRNGRWRVDIPESLREHLGPSREFDNLSDVFDITGRENDGANETYKTYFRDVIERLHAQGRKFGALMLEPVVLGAGGMILVDPLYQKALIDVVRESPHLFGSSTNLRDPAKGLTWSGLPVIFDEVFTGLYRLGRFTSSSFLNTHADISVHAKLLTGGLIPLSVTLASEAVFDAFSSDDKSDALLHGHSYTAHAVGCQVALESLQELQKMDQQGHWAWSGETPATSQDTVPMNENSKPWSMWSSGFLKDLSKRDDRVMGVWALGSVLTISMRGDDGVGYNSKAAAKLQTQLRESVESFGAVHSRVLGNVLYIMASQVTEQSTVGRLQARLRILLEC